MFLHATAIDPPPRLGYFVAGMLASKPIDGYRSLADHRIVCSL
jgi:hypothetical protein